MTHFMFSEDGIAFEEFYPPEPGERCAVCDRRKNKPRQKSSPSDTKKIAAGSLPADRAEQVEDALDALQAFVGADGTSYPRGTLIELLALLGGAHREELRAYFQGVAA
jgi:hypothetical protein